MGRSGGPCPFPEAQLKQKTADIKSQVYSHIFFFKKRCGQGESKRLRIGLTGLFIACLQLVDQSQTYFPQESSLPEIQKAFQK